MKLGVFLDMYDDWNGTLCLNDNDDDLHLIVKGPTVDIIENSSTVKELGLLDADVVCFGFYDNELCVRLNVKKIGPFKYKKEN